MDAEDFRKEVALHSSPLEELVELLLSRMEQLERDVKRLDAENKRLELTPALDRHPPSTCG